MSDKPSAAWYLAPISFVITPSAYAVIPPACIGSAIVSIPFLKK